MSQDMDAPASGTRATIRLREDRFDAMTSVLGFTNDTQRAKLLGVWPKTVRRARAGIIGGEFMAKTVMALETHADRLAEFNLRPTLTELFEVVADATTGQAA